MTVSKALEVNLRDSRVQVTLDPRYNVLLEITQPYYGIRRSLEAFLTEVCHPYKNWRHILTEGRRLALNHFHVFKDHPRGPEGAWEFLALFLEAVGIVREDDLRAEAVEHLLVYLQQIVDETGPDLPRFLPVLNQTLDAIDQWSDTRFALIVRSYYGLKGLADRLAKNAPEGTDVSAMTRPVIRYLTQTCRYWLNEPDPGDWFREALGESSVPPGLAQDLKSLTHFRFSELLAEVDRIRNQENPVRPDTLVLLTRLDGHREIVAAYERLPRKLAKAGEASGRGEQWMLLFLFHMMNLAGLVSIHERVLLDINRTLARLIDAQDPGKVLSLIDQTFQILQQSIRKYPRTALNTILNMGQAVYRTGQMDLVDDFISAMAALGFQTPDLGGVGEDWQIRANEAHILNIRVWMKLCGQAPRWSRRLMSSLIVHLALFGVFIRDTDLFPRDITMLLNADIGPVYNMVKQLCRLFPAYFNDIGAEGRLRDISTAVDEMSRRKDALVHYLRKQSHVESSPQTVVLTEALFEFWRTKDKTPLARLVPPDIYQKTDTQGEYVDGLNLLVNHLFDQGVLTQIRDLLTLPSSRLDAALAEKIPGASPEDRQRLKLTRELYRILYNKYHTDQLDLTQYVEGLHPEHVPHLDRLTHVLTLADPKAKLFGLLEYLETLKQIILSPEAFEAREDIYHKRHIAADIPSMYGSYHEAKFDALGLTFRLEAQVGALFQELMEKIDLKLITRKTLKDIHEHLVLFDRALAVDGIYSQEFKKQLELLTHSLNIRGFSFTQYMDIFRGFSIVVNNVVQDYFNNAHQAQLAAIISEKNLDLLLPRFLPSSGAVDPADLPHRVTEIFLRDRIAGSLGLQQLDGFIGRIMNTAFHQDQELPPDLLRRLLNYDPDRVSTAIHPVTEEISDVIHLGSKGYNLVRLTELGLPVPQGFIVTTEVFRAREVIERFGPARDQFQALLTTRVRWLEHQTGRRFGDSNRPLLLSVRSGSSISQPGMMSTYLNVGLNEEIAEGMSRGGNGRRWFAWDCYRRFLQNYGMSSGLSRDHFDALMNDAKKKLGKPYKKEFSGDEMKTTALLYGDFIRSHGIPIEERPFEQLWQAVAGVFASWHSARARTYRHIMGISNDWGTAVTIMAMVFGNLSQSAGSGVFFTHNPRWSGDKIMLWGDFATGNQGEDVVSGLVETLPISNRQADIEGRAAGVTLETHFPEIHRFMLDLAHRMIHQWGFGPQEMEFTFESPRAEDFHLLQTRDMVLRERPKVFSFDPTPDLAERFLGRGIGVSGGAMAGRLVFSLEDVLHWRKQEPETALILGRSDTVPDDIREIYSADGLLTARGGSTSHAAIVAHRLNKTSVVGCADMVCDERQKTIRFGETILAAGDWISLDGLDGSVYLGRVSGDMKIKERGSISS